MKQNNPLHKEILPQDTEETLWNTEVNSPFLIFWSAFVIKWTTLNRVRWGNISRKHNSNLHHNVFGDTECKGPDSTGKQQHEETIFYVADAQTKTEETGLRRFSAALERHLKYRNKPVGFGIFFLISLILLKVSYDSFSVLHWKFLALVHYKDSRLF